VLCLLPLTVYMPVLWSPGVRLIGVNASLIGAPVQSSALCVPCLSERFSTALPCSLITPLVLSEAFCGHGVPWL